MVSPVSSASSSIASAVASEATAEASTQGKAEDSGEDRKEPSDARTERASASTQASDSVASDEKGSGGGPETSRRDNSARNDDRAGTANRRDADPDDTGRSSDTRPKLPSTRDSSSRSSGGEHSPAGARDRGGDSWLQSVHDFFIPPASARTGRPNPTSQSNHAESVVGNPKDLKTAVAERERETAKPNREQVAAINARLNVLNESAQDEASQTQNEASKKESSDPQKESAPKSSDPLNRKFVYAGVDGQATAVSVLRTEAGRTVVAFDNHTVEVSDGLLDEQGRIKDDGRLATWLRVKELGGELGKDVRSLGPEQLVGTEQEKAYLEMQLRYLQGASEDSQRSAEDYVSLRRELLPVAPTTNDGDRSLQARQAFNALPKDVREAIVRFDEAGGKPDLDKMKQTSVSARYGALLAQLDTDRTYGASRNSAQIQRDIDQLLESQQGKLRLDEDLVRIGYQHGTVLANAVPENQRPIALKAESQQNAASDFKRDLSQFAGQYEKLTGMSSDKLLQSDHRGRVVALTEVRQTLEANLADATAARDDAARSGDRDALAKHEAALQEHAAAFKQFSDGMTGFVARSGLNLGQRELVAGADRVSTVTQLDVATGNIKRDATQDYLNVARSSDFALRA